MESFEQDIGELGNALDEAQKPIIERLQRFLDVLEGKTMPSGETIQRVTAAINVMAARLGRAIACAKEECGHPAKLRWFRTPKSEAGVLTFDHTIDGRRTSHGAHKIVPPLKLVQPAPDLRKKH
jgi:hypothetical protein